MNSKAQVESIIYFFAVIVGMFIVAVVVGYLMNAILSPFGNSLNSVSPTANQTVQGILTKTNGLWDSVFIALFLLNVIILMVSAFLVDVHPLFVFLYIIAVMFLIFLAPNILYAVEQIYNTPAYVDQINRMPMTRFLFDNFIVVLIGIIILSGVIMYAKFKFNSSGGGRLSGNY